MSDNYRLNYRGLQEYTRYLKQYIQDELPVEMRGATRFNDGESGLVPKPVVGDNSKYLKGDGTWSEIPSFITLYDVNKDVIKVNQDETEISFIECNLTKKVDLEGHFTMSFFSTEVCNITIRIKDDNVTEIFTPQIYEVQKGYNSIGIPHAYIMKQAGLHYFTVTMQCSNGEITIPTRSLLYTIFGAIDDNYTNSGIDIIDMAIKKEHLGLSPSEIWSLGFDETHLMLRTNEYNNPNSNRWNDIFDFGECIGGCIEFYGTWNLDNLNNNFNLVTEDNPYVFIINSNNELIVYLNGNYENGTILANNVTQVNACTGYKSNIDPSLDQGLIVTYIKNNKAYYRQWKYYTEEENLWYAEEELDVEDDVIHVSVHRLPDYRVGFLIKTTDENKWLISDRTFIGNIARNEYASVGTRIKARATVIDYDRLDEATGVAEINSFPDTQAYHNGFVMTFEGNLTFIEDTTIDDLKNVIRAYRNGVEVSISDVIIEDNVLTVYTENDVKGDSSFTISWNLEDLLVTIYNNCLIDITSSYTWNLPTLIIRESSSDEANAQVDAQATIDISQIIDIKKNVTDSNTSTVDVDAEILVHQIMDIYKQYSDSDLVNTDIDATIDVIQISDVPV